MDSNLRDPDTPSVFLTSAADLDPVSALVGTVVAFAAFRVFGRRRESPVGDARGGEAA